MAGVLDPCHILIAVVVDTGDKVITGVVESRVSDLDPHFWRPWIWIQIRISKADPDPRLIIKLEIQQRKYKKKLFLLSF